MLFCVESIVKRSRQVIWSHVLDIMGTFVSSRRVSDRQAGFLFVEPGFTSSSRSCFVKAVVSLRRVALRRGRIDLS